MQDEKSKTYLLDFRHPKEQQPGEEMELWGTVETDLIASKGRAFHLAIF